MPRAPGAGLYFQLADGECFVAGGMWMPERTALDRIREAIADSPAGLERILGAPAFRRRFGRLDAEDDAQADASRVRGEPPGGELLRYRSFTATRMLKASEVESSRLPALLERDFAALVPLVRWLNTAIGYRSWTRRY